MVILYIIEKEKGEIIMKKRTLILDFILTMLTGGLWLIWLLIKFLRSNTK